MELFEGFRKSGMFVISDDSEIYGDLILNGSKSTLDAYSRKAFNTNKIQNACILGELHDRTKVSLIDCITTLPAGGGYRGDKHYYSSSFFPHYVIVGDEHIRPEDKKIEKVSFHVTDDTPLFYDLHAFGMVINTAPYLAKIADEIREKGGDITLGDDPHLFYFTGKYEIFKAVTDLGVVTAEHRPSYGMPGPSGNPFQQQNFRYYRF
ncbi:hypothetical protein [Deefgea sp. CFH1-16]|uniref:ApeA N-terminal domain 1-containing protein n=1 Tax=Deefgea sp. CFH1-16 TaxID=2675457 RepID=UPI0015F649C9|nr:hypothetical protein [Deefgea sp. CFH1-16]MBM5575173.1 hypothetical protein [Deefgea sp. CFH1-16]